MAEVGEGVMIVFWMVLGAWLAVVCMRLFLWGYKPRVDWTEICREHERDFRANQDVLQSLKAKL